MGIVVWKDKMEKKQWKTFYWEFHSIVVTNEKQKVFIYTDKKKSSGLNDPKFWKDSVVTTN